jgi:hypothetical protein
MGPLRMLVYRHSHQQVLGAGRFPMVMVWEAKRVDGRAAAKAAAAAAARRASGRRRGWTRDQMVDPDNVEGMSDEDWDDD